MKLRKYSGALLTRLIATATLASAVAISAQDVRAGDFSKQHMSQSAPEKNGKRRLTASRCAAARDAIDATALDRLISGLRAGSFGKVDEFLLYSDACLISKVRIKQDYVQAYHGSKSPVSEYDYRSATIHPFYRGSSLHTVQSITKSITGILYAIALQRGDMKGLDTPVMAYFDRATVQNLDTRKDAIRVRHLMNMTSGLDWRDEPDSADLEQKTQDWASFAIDKPMIDEPGAHFLYTNGGGALLAHVFVKETGIDIARYAERHLFKPLGIKAYHWKRTPNGLVDTTGGLYLAAEDLAKIGQLVLDRGKWNGRQIYPPDFIDPSRTIPTGKGPDMSGYNNLFWMPTASCAGELILAGNGYGGQRLLIFPERRGVAVFYSWNIDQFFDALPARAALSETSKIFKAACPPGGRSNR